MTDPVLLLALPFVVAFLLPALDRLGRAAVLGAHLSVLAYGLGLSVYWVAELGLLGGRSIDIATGGWPAPWGIVLRLGGPEAGLLALAFASALLTVSYLWRKEADAGVKGHVLQLMVLVGAVGLILSRDLFNIFVFIEIAAIGTYALVLYGWEQMGLEAGLKYMLMGAVASVLILIAVGLLYRATGTLYLDGMAAGITTAVFPVLVVLLVGFLVELKLFPVNGPAIDLYDGAHPGAMALIVGTVLNAVFFAFTKVYALLPAEFFQSATMAFGMATYVVSNLFAIRQSRVRRLLGYSSSAQMGLLVFLWPLAMEHEAVLFAVMVILFNHTIAKTGLLWLSGIYRGLELEDWRGVFKRTPLLGTLLTVLILSICAVPPFPAFWGKWEALVTLAQSENLWPWMVPLLVGAFLEWVYYFNWFRMVLETDETRHSRIEPDRGTTEWAGPVAAAAAAVGLGGWLLLDRIPMDTTLLPAVSLLGTGAVILALRFLPHRTLAVMALAAIAAYIPSIPPLGEAAHPLVPLFLLMTVGGSLLVGVGMLAYGKAPKAVPGLWVILTAAMLLLVLSAYEVRSDALLIFFVGWEMMTWATTLIIARGSARASYMYVLFSAAAGFLILAGLMVAEGTSGAPLAKLAGLEGGQAALAWSLIVLGLAVKIGSFGVHIWAQSAYAEAPDHFSPFLAAVVSKAPVFGLLVIASQIPVQPIRTDLGTIDPMQVMAWVGAVTSFGLALLAAVQEDAKKLLAYSSLGHVAYIMVGCMVATPLGWTAALFLAINHFLYKALLFLAMAGVIYRTRTDTMYRMGGLIKRMPATFVMVLIGIIAVSGVPPLSGFAGKWLIYEALVDRGWLFLTGLMMFSAVVSFLYLYRLIHTIFLGQMKRRHREVREAPLPLLIPQGILVAALMVLAVWPQAVLEPIATILAQPSGLFQPQWAAATSALTVNADWTLSTPLGNFAPVTVMMVTMALFGLLFVTLLLVIARPRWVRQGDMVYQAEMPPPPEEAHYAYAMFKPYERALAPLLVPRVERFWATVADTVNAVTEAGRRFYSGNAQTYLFYAVTLIVVLTVMGRS